MTTATSNDLVISPGLYDEETGSIEVLPTFSGDENLLKSANSILFNAVTAEENSISTNVAQGQNFFYGIEQFNNQSGSLRKLLLSETGIGELGSSEDKIILNREHVFEQSLEDEFYTPVTSESFLKFDSDSYLILTTYIPTDYIQLCSQEHAVICTTDPFAPTPVELSTNTVLGRADGNIEALDSTEIHKILGYTDPTEAVKSYTDSLVLATSLLELTGSDALVVCNQLHIRSRSAYPATKTKGYLIFNDGTKSFEAYDGTGWRRLAWEGESSDPEDTQMLTYTWDGYSWTPLS